MNGTVPSEGSDKEQDFRLLIGTQPFDPKEAATRARRQPAADAGTGSFGRGEAARKATIVQFTQGLTAPDMARLRAEYGLKLDQYIPNLAFLERLTQQTIGRLKGDFLVRACIDLDPALKLAPWIGGAGVQPPDDASLVHDFEATLFDDAAPDAVETALAAVGARDIKVLDDRDIGGSASVHFVLDELGDMSQVADIEDIVWVEPVTPITITSVAAAATIQSGSAPNTSIWNRGLHGEGQVIGVIDNGPPDIRHCFFADAALDRAGPNHRKVVAVRDASTMVDQGPDPNPLSRQAWLDHATFVCGIAVGDQLNNSGSHPDRGGAWAAKLVCGNQNDFLGRNAVSSLLGELTDARDSGAFIHSNSWTARFNPGDPSGDYTLRALEVDLFTWRNEDHLVLGAGANSGERRANNDPPGIAKNAICVAATMAVPDHMRVGSGVAGPTSDGRRKPDLMAVGGGIESAIVRNTLCETSAPSTPRTSWATPHAAAAAALVRQYFTEGWYPTGKKAVGTPLAFTPTGALIKAVLLNSTVDMTRGSRYPSYVEGWGLIQLDRTLYFEGEVRKLAVWDVRHAVGLTPLVDIRTHEIIVLNGAEQLKVTLVWTDRHPALVSFAKPVVNDLDLKVTAPDGTEYVGNDFTNGVSTPNGRQNDSLNNVEMVVVNTPVSGKWLLEVHGVVHQGQPGQGYALVATGAL